MADFVKHILQLYIVNKVFVFKGAVGYFFTCFTVISNYIFCSG